MSMQIMQPVTGDEILAALARDPEWVNQPPQMMEATVPFIYALPGRISNELLFAPVGFKTLMQVRVAHLKALLQSDWPEKAFAQAEDAAREAGNAVHGQSGIFDALFDLAGGMDMREYVIATMRAAVETLEEYISQAEQIVAQYDETELLFQMGVRLDLAEQGREGALSINDLLRKQPLVCLKGSN